VIGIRNESHRRHPISAVLEVQKAVKDGSEMNRICVWCLRTQLMKLTMKAHASCATKRYQNSSVG
jgi:hypothetical protein